jgi:hypothetical protein
MGHTCNSVDGDKPADVRELLDSGQGNVEIRNVVNNKVPDQGRAVRTLRPAGALDKPAEGALKAAAQAELRDCGSGAEQVWDVTALSETRFELRNRASQCASAASTRSFAS